VRSPPAAPAPQRASVDPELPAQRLSPARRDSVSQGRHHNHDGAEVHVAPQKAQRRRRPTPSASLAVTTEAQPPLVLGREIRRTPTGLARVVRSMQSPSARAPLGARLLGEILVECGQKSEESGVAQQGVPHWRPPVGVGISGDQPPPELASSSVRGLFAVGKSRRKSDYARSAAGKEPRILITFRDGKSSNPSPILIRNRALPIDLCDCSDPTAGRQAAQPADQSRAKCSSSSAKRYHRSPSRWGLSRSLLIFSEQRLPS
jgi:hypothetical protein